MTLTVGTIYSGTDAPIFALKKCKVKCKHVFSVENNKHARKFIEMNTPPQKMYRDMDELDIKEMPGCDLLVAGPPCQQLSVLNQWRLKKAMVALQPIIHVLQYLLINEPKCGIIENVIGIQKYWYQSLKNVRTKTFSGAWNACITPLMRKLQKVYYINVDILTPIHFDCPHSRRRCYIVFSKKKFEFPNGKLTKKTYFNIIDSHDTSMDDYPLILYHKRVISDATGKYGSKFNAGVTNLNALGAQVREKRSKPRPWSPYARCLIADNKSIVFQLRRYLTVRELLLFQGFPLSTKVTGLSYNQINKIIGNAMNINVLLAIFKGLGL